MADKKISDFTGLTTVDVGDVGEVETVGGNSRKVRAGADGTACGTSFPGGPTTGDRIWRTDRNIEYFYDGTRWLSTQLFVLPLVNTDAVLPITGGTSFRAPCPWTGIYAVYVENGVVVTFPNTGSTNVNYFTTQFNYVDVATSTNLGSAVSSQNDTQNNWVPKAVAAINVVVPSTADIFQLTITETNVGNAYIVASLTYRLVG